MSKAKKNPDLKAVTDAPEAKTAKNQKARAAARRKAAGKGAKAAKVAPKVTKSKADGEGRIVRWVRTPLERISYVKRTLAILEDGARKRAKLREAQVKELGKVWQDLQDDVQAQIEGATQATRDQLAGVADQIKETRVVKEVAELPERVTGQLDVLLERVGLVRRAVFLEATGRKALPARAAA